MWVPSNQSFRYGKFKLEKPFRRAMLLYIIKFNYSPYKSLILILHTWLNNEHCICKSFTQEKTLKLKVNSIKM